MANIVQDAYTQVADVVEATILEEFDDLEYLQIHHDRIHESLGADSSYHIGISPESTDPRPRGIQDTALTIQFYGPYYKDVDPLQEVDPRLVTNQAERLTRALARNRTISTSQAWYFTVGTVRFVPDPTGNKSRFEMSVSAVGDNMGLVETFG